MSDLPSAILVISSASHGISFATATGSASSAIALTMSMRQHAGRCLDRLRHHVRRTGALVVCVHDLSWYAVRGKAGGIGLPSLLSPWADRIRPDKTGMSRV